MYANNDKDNFNKKHIKENIPHDEKLKKAVINLKTSFIENIVQAPNSPTHDKSENERPPALMYKMLEEKQNARKKIIRDFSDSKSEYIDENPSFLQSIYLEIFEEKCTINNSENEDKLWTQDKKTNDRNIHNSHCK